MYVLVERFFSSKKRKKLASSGAAMKDGSFPIENEKDLRNAEKLSGHGKNPEAARQHIRQRAKALGLETHLQEGTAVFSINLREAIRDIIKLHEEDDTGDEQENNVDGDISLRANKSSKLQAKIGQVFSHLPKRQIAALQQSVTSHSMMRKFAGLVGLDLDKVHSGLDKKTQADSRLSQNALMDALTSHLHNNPSAVTSFKYSSMFPEAPSGQKTEDATQRLIAIAQKRAIPIPTGVVPPDPKKAPTSPDVTAATSSEHITATSGRGPTDPLRPSTIGNKGKETLSFTPEQITSISASGIKDAKGLVTPHSRPEPPSTVIKSEPKFVPAQTAQKGDDSFKSVLSTILSKEGSKEETDTAKYYRLKAQKGEEASAEASAKEARNALLARQERIKSAKEITAASLGWDRGHKITAPPQPPAVNFSLAAETPTDLEVLRREKRLIPPNFMEITKKQKQ